MARSAPLDVPAADDRTQQQRLQACLHALHAPGWKQRLEPLARHMADRCLVRSRGYAGAFARHLHLEVLREALSQLLQEQWEDGYLIVQLVIESAEPSVVAAEYGATEAMLVEQLRDAIDELALYYEDRAYDGVPQTKQEPMRTKATGKRG